jgi:hypothetical protein
LRGVDHYKCYDVKKASKLRNLEVSLKDQFNTEQVKVLKATMFCNPVEKKHDGTVTPISNPQGHLTCYEINAGKGSAKSYSKDSKYVTVKNQLGEEKLRIKSADSLCVPSEKLQVIHGHTGGDHDDDHKDDD